MSENSKMLVMAKITIALHISKDNLKHFLKKKKSKISLYYYKLHGSDQVFAFNFRVNI